jgi:hypothetical protein
MTIPPPPQWLILAMIAVAIYVVFFLGSCSHPFRLDPVRQRQLEAQQRQDECLRQGGSPERCRP